MDSVNYNEMDRILHPHNSEDSVRLNGFSTKAPPRKPTPSQGFQQLISRPDWNWSSQSMASSTDEGNLVRDWKAWTMKGPFFAVFVVICIAFIGVAEGLLQISRERGSVMDISGPLADSKGELPLSALCLFDYLPTLLAVLLGLLAARMDHDFKRLEPYFQLSQPAGADAANSLLLDYPYRFAVAIPFVSFSRRHWSVFFSSTILVVVLFIVTPLMSGLFERATITRTSRDVATQAEVMPLERQESSFSTRFAYLAYQYTWRDRSALPKFTTADFAALPLDFKSIKADRFQDREHWVVKTTKYEADLDCEPGVSEWESIEKKHNWSLVHITGTKSQCKYTLGITNSERELYRGWRARLSLREAMRFEGDYSTLLMNHKVNVREPLYNRTYYSLSARNRTECHAKNVFLGIWTDQMFWNMNHYNGTWKGDAYVPHTVCALFCKPSYWKQEVEIKVSVETGMIANSTTIGEREPFTEFSREAFEDAVVTGRLVPEKTIWDTLPGMNDFGYFPAEFPDADYQLRENSGADWLLEQSGVRHLNPRSLTSFAMEAEDPQTLPYLFYPPKLSETYKKAFRLLFAFAVSEELVEYKESGNKIPIERVFRVEAFVIDEVWCRLLQTALGFIIVWAGALYFKVRKRPINLDGDPSPLAVTMMTICTSYALHSDLQGTEFMSQHLLEEVLLWKGHRYYLRLIEGVGPQIDRMKESTFATSKRSTRVLELFNSKEALTPVKREPEWELTIAFGATVLACFLALLIGFIYLFIYDRKHSGIPRIGGSSFVSRLLFSYLPTLVAVSIEPLWALLGRYACMVTPFEHLSRKGGMPGRSAITTNCERTPPHFQLWHACSLKSTLVGVLASAILFANLLTIALSGLFLPLKAIKSVDDQYYNAKQPVLWPQNISVPAQERLRKPFPESQVLPEPEVFYVLWGNLSGHHELPQWTSKEYYFLPQVSTKYEGAAGHKEVVKRRVKTRGFGADLKCKLLKNEDWDVTLNVSSNSYHAEIEDKCAGRVTLNRAFSPGVKGRSAPDSGYEWSPEVWNSTDFIKPLTNWSSPRDSKCWSNFIVGWGQGEKLPSGEFSKAEMVGLKCSQELRTVEAWVDVSPKETILSVERLPNTEQSLPDSFFSPDALALAKKSEIPVQSSLDLSFQWGLANSASKLNKTLGALFTGALDPSFEPHPLKWINHLMRLSDLTMNGKETHLPNEATLVETFEKTITSLFAIYLSIHSQSLFLPAPVTPQPSSSSSVFSSLLSSSSSSSSSDPTPTPIPGYTYLTDDRITLSQTMFTIAILIISFFILVTLLVYTIRPGRKLTHMPTTLAAMYALVYASNALDDLAGIMVPGYKERLKAFEGLEYKYIYGEFVGGDGKLHFGVFKEAEREIL
ncbi:hypothetical protein HOY80DRAFT_1059128 [Tuber brumale]|nr:hypothetical protein HOY80DRAFT_1059128 [Tuber brumale]